MNLEKVEFFRPQEAPHVQTSPHLSFKLQTSSVNFYYLQGNDGESPRTERRGMKPSEQYGIQFVETEESYTSKASFLDGDLLPVFGAKPEGWNKSGRRVKRGMYRTKKGEFVNADANGAANILRKVETQLGLDLAQVSRAFLTAPSRVFLWNSKKIKLRDGVSNPSRSILLESPALKRRGEVNYRPLKVNLCKRSL